MNPNTFRPKRRPRVTEISAPPRLETGPAIDTWTSPQTAVVMVHWADQPKVSKSVSESVRQLSERGYHVVVCSSSEVPAPLEWPHGLAPDVSVYRRPNIGYDFGTWASMLHAFPNLGQAPNVILLNDSMVGPFAPISDILDRVESSKSDVWGLVSTTQDRPHLQSHFVVYKGGILAEPSLSKFWRDVRVEPTKRDLILRYEIGLWPVLRSVGYKVEVGFPWHLVVGRGGNPTSAGWRRLLLWGFPWVKREIVLRPPPEVPDGVDVRRVVRELYGEDVLEWL